jgi:hypothetical protein
MIEHIEMPKRFNELHSQWLHLCRARYDLSSVTVRMGPAIHEE